MNRRNYRHGLLLAAGLFFVFVVFSCFAAEESITLTTYYPSPYGVYSEMRLYPKLESEATACVKSQEGLMFYDRSMHALRVCRCDSGGACILDSEFDYTASNYWTLSDTETDLYPNNPAWNVGIGTNSPGIYKLKVGGRTNLQVTEIGNEAGVWTRLDYGGGGTNNKSIIYATSGNYLSLGSNNNYDQLNIVNGNVGIGTTDPIGALTFSGSTGTNIDFNTDITNRFGMGYGPALLQIFAGNQLATYKVQIGAKNNTTFTPTATFDTTSGNVGIGTVSPAEKLEVSGNIKLSGASATYKITNVVNPTSAQDVATKAYVDAQASSGPGSWTCTVRSGIAAWFNSNAICVSPEKAISGGCQLFNNIAYSSYPTSQGWYCDTVSTPNQIRAYANCCK